MSQENAAKETSPVAALFQKAHAKMVMLQRVEEQFTSMLAQRSKLQEELRALQAEINDEFNRTIEPGDSAPMPMIGSDKSSKHEPRFGDQAVAAEVVDRPEDRTAGTTPGL